MKIFISLMEMTEKKVSELEELLVEIIQSAEERKWIWKDSDNLDKMGKFLEK